MSLCVVGSIAFDSVKTPFGEVERELGGSGTHASLAASFFTDTRLVAAVGEDFGPQHLKLFTAHGVAPDLDRIPGGRTLNWSVRYDLDMALPQPEYLDLGVFDGWRPTLSPEAAAADTLFLGVMDPEAQIEVRSQWKGGGWVALDTLTYWIDTKREALVEAISGADIILLNDQEARGLTAKPSLMQAAREVRSWGPTAVVIKHGEFGCSLLTEDGYFALPGYPLEVGTDPTGTGDSFAGGLLGYLDLAPGDELSEGVMRRAVTYGSVMASFCIEEFGTRRIAMLTDAEMSHRFNEFKRMTHFEHVPLKERPREGGVSGERMLEHPGLTAGTQPVGAPGRTAGTASHGNYGRTPSTETLRPATKPSSD